MTPEQYQNYVQRVTGGDSCTPVTIGGHSNPDYLRSTWKSPYYDEIALEGTAPFAIHAGSTYAPMTATIDQGNKKLIIQKASATNADTPISVYITNCDGGNISPEIAYTIVNT